MSFFCCSSSGKKNKSWTAKDKISEEDIRNMVEKDRKSIISSSNIEVLSKQEVESNKKEVGLVNHGNTCYINSVLQSMISVDVLTNYLMTGGWRDEINTRSPMGTECKLLFSYISVLFKRWKTDDDYISLSDFVKQVGRSNSTVI
jgi:ubiquitin C-terminal hydrolase